MKDEIVQKYIRDPKALKREVQLWKQRFDFPEEETEEVFSPIYHETVIFLFAIIYKYLVFENPPIFTGGNGLDAWIEHRGDKIDVEFEKLSSDLLQPKHHTDEEIEKCKLLVCWRDSSRKKQDCWKHIDVFELRHFWEKPYSS
jgi:hypothetical protein